ncbi:hypothetical protein [Sinomonas mesophila]|uniref:hypothetical protein n=1 Tax=Sinomonas mesophila TaxID=1531955 RepID=UPI0009872744|nr:hypothetical protein [Sinomonas mesophila]
MTSRNLSPEEIRALAQELVYLSGVRPHPGAEPAAAGRDERAAARSSAPLREQAPSGISVAELRSLVAQMRDANGLPPPGTGPGSSELAEEPSPGPASVNVSRYLPRIVAFRDKQGRLPRTGPTIPQPERTLGMWLYRRRRAKEAGTLTREDEAAITDALGFGWSERQRGPRPS